MEEVFLQRVRDSVERNVGDEDFGVEQLAAAVGMSRVHLYRRLRALTDQTPTEVLSNIRLERAAQLLAQHAGNVSDVAYGVGFRSVSHFGKRFRHRYGTTPSAYAATHGSSSPSTELTTDARGAPRARRMPISPARPVTPVAMTPYSPRVARKSATPPKPR